MNKQDYRRAMNRIKISESFQARTAQLMQEVRDGKNSGEADEKPLIYMTENEKRRFPPFLKYGGLIAAAVMISFTAGVMFDRRPSEDDISNNDTGGNVIVSETAAPTAAAGAVPDDADAVDDVIEAEYDDADAGEDVIEGEYDDSIEEDALVEAPVEAPVEGMPDEASSAEDGTQPETAVEVLDGAPMVGNAAFVPEAQLLRSLLETEDTIGGYAENSFYILSEEHVKAPLGEENIEHTEIEEFPAELISMTADILENAEPMETAVSPEEYAKDSDLYMPLNWNGTTFVFGFRSENYSFAFTVCGHSITSLNSGLSYPLTEEAYLKYSEYSVDMVGGTLIPTATPAADTDDVPDSEE